MKCRTNNRMGEITIDSDVVAKLAGTAAMECFGIVGMASVSVKDGLVKLLMKDNLTHGINVTIEDDKLTIDFHVIVAYGVSIATVAENLIEFDLQRFDAGARLLPRLNVGKPALALGGKFKKIPASLRFLNLATAFLCLRKF